MALDEICMNYNLGEIAATQIRDWIIPFWGSIMKKSDIDYEIEQV